MAIHNPGSPYIPQASEEKTHIKVDSIQAPTGGIDARAPVGMMPPDVSVYSYNMMPSEYGMQLRQGYREWVHGAGPPARTLMTTLGLDPGSADNRLFAVTQDAIYDVTVEGVPVSKLALPSQAGGAGHGVYCHYIDEAVKDWMLYADGENGLYEYDGDLDTWAINTTITAGPVIADIRFCMVHKQRLWVFEKDTTTAYYLPVSAKNGIATAFHFGAKFSHGGRLAGLYNWTVDGGVGVDDLFVVVSTSGDVIVYKGEDPSASETWSVHGTYYVGEIPIGRRFAGEYAGDIYLLSSFGLTAMSDLIRGVDSQNSAEKSLSYKVAKPLRDAIRKDLESYGWEPIFMPANGSLVIMTPFEPGLETAAIQYVMNLSTEAWGFWRGVPAVCAASFKGIVFFGDQTGSIWVMDQWTDGGTQADPEGDKRPIPFSLVSSTQHYGSPGLFKQVQMVRPDFWGGKLPDYNITVKYDFDQSEANYVLPTVDDPSPDDFKGYNKLSGIGGIGRTCTIAMSGSASHDVRLISWDVMWTVGGPV